MVQLAHAAKCVQLIRTGEGLRWSTRLSGGDGQRRRERVILDLRGRVVVPFRPAQKGGMSHHVRVHGARPPGVRMGMLGLAYFMGR